MQSFHWKITRAEIDSIVHRLAALLDSVEIAPDGQTRELPEMWFVGLANTKIQLTRQLQSILEKLKQGAETAK